MNVPFIDLKTQHQALRDELNEAIRQVMDRADFALGKDVACFEQEFAAFCGTRYAVAVDSGLSALDLGLRAFGVGPGDQVIVPAHTFIATAEAISAVGARPVFVDIEPDTYTMDPQALEAAITPRTRAVIPVHIYGQPANMQRILEIGRAHGIAVIEDAAQAHGATWDGAMAGTLADAACFSFDPGKNLGAYGDAGAVTTDLPEIAGQVRSLRNHGRRSKYLHDQIGFGLRIDALQAAILHAKLPYLEEWVVARNRVAERYTQGLSDTDLTLPAISPHARHGWHLYVVRSPARDTVLEHLQTAGIGAGVHYPVPLHLQPAYAYLGYAEGALPVSEEVARTCLSLPMYPELDDEQIDAVVTAVRAAIPVRVLSS